MNDFEERILKTIKKYNLIEEKDKIVLGVSGGPDSIAMLSVLYEIKKQEKIDFDIYVAHINHGIRENAKLDEEFVKNFCLEKNIQFFVLHTNIKQLAKENKKGIEETGREIRYNFFTQIMKQTNSNKIAIAHNKKDNIETIIMNILRGSGVSGLCGMDLKQGIYIRPLLLENRTDIEEYLKLKNIVPRIDESNFENDYTRNKIRNVVLPYIEKEFNSNFIETLSRLSLIIKEEDEYLQSITVENYKNILIEEKNLNICKLDKNIVEKNVYKFEDLPTIILDLKKFNSLDKVIEKRIILYSIGKLFGSTKGIEKIHIDDIIKLCNNNIGNKYLTPNKNTKVVIKNKKIYISAIK